MEIQTARVETIDLTDIARAAGQVAMSHFRNALDIDLKSDESPVTQADRATEAEVRRIIAERFPDHGIYGEEHGIECGNGRDMWIVDPIDGTRSFITGHPLFGFLLAKLTDGRAEHAAVSLPAIGETFVAARGQGAWNGNTRLHVSTKTDLTAAALYINEGERIWRGNADRFARLMNTGQTRRFAYDCHPYTLLAAGHIDAVIDAGLQPYDYLPVSLLVEEAGGIMTDWSGASLAMDTDVNTVAAATPELHAELVALLAA